MTASGWELVTTVLLAMLAFPISLALTRFLMSFSTARGIFGVDVHKLSKPKIPEMCGASIPLALVLLAVAYGSWRPEARLAMTAYGVVVGSTALVGALDDRLRLRGYYKPILALFCGLPITVMGLMYPGEIYGPTLRIPLFGGFHLPVIYPLTIPIAISVTSNSVNMLDPLNGTMAGSVAILSGGLLIGLLLTSSQPMAVFLSASLLFSSLGFFYYNKYPSRAFSGNVGQLAVGGAVGAMAILGRIEIATIVAMFPHIQNSFFFLSKIKRFAEHREVSAKPTKLLEDERLSSSLDPKAPLTLVRTMLVGKPATEPDVVNSIFVLFLFSTSLAVVTLILTR